MFDKTLRVMERHLLIERHYLIKLNENRLQECSLHQRNFVISLAVKPFTLFKGLLTPQLGARTQSDKWRKFENSYHLHKIFFSVTGTDNCSCEFRVNLSQEASMFNLD